MGFLKVMLLPRGVVVGGVFMDASGSEWCVEEMDPTGNGLSMEPAGSANLAVFVDCLGVLSNGRKLWVNLAFWRLRVIGKNRQ